MRKIIHIDMDCYYAQVEELENPSLKSLPLAIGGESERRGVLCTCNYIARQYGLHAAMPTKLARMKCPELVLIYPDIEKYKRVSTLIHQIFESYTERVEPLSLDEAYLDVSHSSICHGSATLIAKKIKTDIYQKLNLVASAGVGPNKLIAKIASDLDKPNGLYVVAPKDVDSFIANLRVSKLFGVGPKLREKLNRMGIETCKELSQLTISELIARFGKMGVSLYQYSRGIDNREVKAREANKSLSVETTFSKDIQMSEPIAMPLEALFKRLMSRWKKKGSPKFDKVFIKLKFADFQISNREEKCPQASLPHLLTMVEQLRTEKSKPIRLIGLGLRLLEPLNFNQLSFNFSEEYDG